MPVYSEVLNDDVLIQKVGKKHKDILLLGCGACMNESLAYKNDSQIFVNDEYGNKIPYSNIKRA